MHRLQRVRCNVKKIDIVKSPVITLTIGTDRPEKNVQTSADTDRTQIGQVEVNQIRTNNILIALIKWIELHFSRNFEIPKRTVQ